MPTRPVAKVASVTGGTSIPSRVAEIWSPTARMLIVCFPLGSQPAGVLVPSRSCWKLPSTCFQKSTLPALRTSTR